MTRDDIIRMALEAGFSKDFSGLYFSCGGSAADSDLTPALERFAHLVAAAEREACAEIAQQIDQNGLSNYGAVIAVRILGKD